MKYIPDLSVAANQLNWKPYEEKPDVPDSCEGQEILLAAKL